MITGPELVRAAFLDPRLALRRAPQQPDAQSPDAKPRRVIDATLMNQGPEYHARVKRLAAGALTPRRVETYRSRIEAAVAGQVDRLADTANSAESGEVDLMASFARPVPFLVLCEVFAVPEDERAALHGWMSLPFESAGRDPAALAAAADGLDCYVRELVRRRRAEPADDLVSSIVRTWMSTGGGSADSAAEGGNGEDEVVSLCAMLLLAGFDSTVQAIGMYVLGLVTHPEASRRLRADPATMRAAIDELLRWDTPGPFATPRVAIADVQIADTVIPAGSTVLLSIAAANHDPDRYPAPDLFDVDRKTSALDGDSAGTRVQHLSFGLGEHYCPGASLAKLELEVALTMLLQRSPAMRLAVPPSELRWRGNHTYRRLLNLPLRLPD